MTLALGVDTGGTYTDAVLIRDERDVIASAKALTTREDLALGIGEAVRRVLTDARVAATEVGMASLSTTLATNALVEGHGGRVGLVLIGFKPQDLDKHGLTEALAGDPSLVIAGGHSHSGEEAAPLDLAQLTDWAQEQNVTAFAVAAQFATRNPAHEIAARDALRACTKRPVTCSHELSAKLGGPKRALTALLNARLIGLTHRLIGRAEAILAEIGITAPMMVVRGDGALMSSDIAKLRPIETILSGPAASIVGARWLTGADEALVSDIGGTTTDIALLRNGRPAIDPDGARVGPYRTMVEAVAMRTHGLGGDSQVHLVTEGLSGGILLGPQRLVPVSLAVERAPELQDVMEQQLRRSVPSEHDGRFVFQVLEAEPSSAREAAVLERLTQRPRPISEVLITRLDGQALGKLVNRGVAQISGLTPTDAVHVLGRASHWSVAGAHLAMRLLARRRIGTGDRVAASAEQLAQLILDQLTYQTQTALLEAVFAEEGWDLPPGDLAQHPLMHAALTGHSGLLDLKAHVSVPIIGLGASAACHYPAVGRALGATVALPEHAGVANAIGAVVGKVTLRKSGTITSPSEGQFRVHLPDGPRDFASAEDAIAHLRTHLSDDAQAQVRAAGAQDITIKVTEDRRTARVESRDVFVEAVLTVEASGRPRVATA